ncbi:hypothetical protein KDA_57310 [Dictyobacter alpinus]|uniref:Uncharacterized protein n=1 Tax=Dictyobacter alpinus TaxID=2014873 RepID=A0A402BG54_9CHLR|nr:hypothetical protein KDA_57310 [Dictyobacter alpinus]
MDVYFLVTCQWFLPYWRVREKDFDPQVAIASDYYVVCHTSRTPFAADASAKHPNFCAPDGL